MATDRGKIHGGKSILGVHVARGDSGERDNEVLLYVRLKLADDERG